MDKKAERIIDIYSRLCRGDVINKENEALRFNVSKRSIQRDIENIRAYFSNNYDFGQTIKYVRAEKGYRLFRNGYYAFTNSEILTVCKIMLESRSLVKDEMFPIIDKLLQNCVPNSEFKKVSALISNEKFHYLEPHHGRKFVNIMWDIGNAVYEQRLMKIYYHKLKGQDDVIRLIQPVGIMFSEFYFYLIAYICESEETPDVPKNSFPAIYRIDRISKYEILKKQFYVPYANRFEEGEFRKRIQFMFGGELRTIKFLYKGLSIEAVLDKLPTAQVIEHNELGWILTAEVYGNGIDMWLRSQGDMVELIEDKAGK